MKKQSVPIEILEEYVCSLEPDQARKSMFDPKDQRMDVIEYDEEAIDLLYSLMGSEVEPRRDFIMQNVDFSKIRE